MALPAAQAEHGFAQLPCQCLGACTGQIQLRFGSDSGLWSPKAAWKALAERNIKIETRKQETQHSHCKKITTDDGSRGLEAVADIAAQGPPKGMCKKSSCAQIYAGLRAQS